MAHATLRDGRLSIRIDPARKDAITRAAASQGTTVSDFVLDHAFQMANVLLADEGTTKLTKRQVAHVFETLDRPPPKSLAALRKLLSDPSVLDG